MDESSYIGEARKYLLSLPGVTDDMLERQLKECKRPDKKPEDMRALFHAFLEHAKNRRNMPNTIGKVDQLSKVLFDFDPHLTAERYECLTAELDKSGKLIFNTIQASSYRSLGRWNKRRFWPVYCKSIASIAKFLSSYQTIKDFDKFVSGFQTDAHLRLALPLLLEEEIFGFGFALACDFLKESGYQKYVKPDTHLNFIALKLGITKETSNYHIFKDVIAYCERIGAIPYEVDKLFWLVGSGKFYLTDAHGQAREPNADSDWFQAKSSRVEFVKRIKAKQPL